MLGELKNGGSEIVKKYFFLDLAKEITHSNSITVKKSKSNIPSCNLRGLLKIFLKNLNSMVKHIA